MQLALVIGVFRQRHIEAPAVLRVIFAYRWYMLAPGSQVARFVGQQGFGGRQRGPRWPFRGLCFFLCQPHRAMEVPGPGFPGIAVEPSYVSIFLPPLAWFIA